LYLKQEIVFAQGYFNFNILSIEMMSILDIIISTTKPVCQRILIQLCGMCV
jgi:hypothetical protein